MSALAFLQNAFATALRGGPLDAGLLRPRANGEPALFRIYEHAYASRLAEALRDNYPVLARAMGDEPFAALAAAYVAATPSCEPSIRWYGDALAAFMFSDGAPGLHPALGDLAKLEWALRTAFDAADASVVPAAALAGVEPERWACLRFVLQPAAQTLALDWSVEPVWHALQRFEPERGASEPQLPEPLAHAHDVLVWRRGLEPCFRSMERDEALAIAAIASGEAFGAMCAVLAERSGPEHASLAAATFLTQWLADELIAAVQTAK
jgi:hypothetical protein